MRTLQIIFLVLLLSTFSSAYAGDCFKDTDATHCREKAEQRDAKAQLHLGLMYEQGKGVIQDYIMAHMYFNTAEVSRDKSSIKNRENVEKEANI